MKISVYAGVTETRPKKTFEGLNVNELATLLTTPKRIKWTRAELEPPQDATTAEKKEIKQRKAVDCYILGACEERTTKGLQSRDGIVLDYDDGKPGDIERAAAALDGYAFIIYTTARHTAEKPKYRVILPLAEPITKDIAATYAATVKAVRRLLETAGVTGCDPQSTNAAQLMYWYTLTADGDNTARTIKHLDGELLTASEPETPTPAKLAATNTANTPTPRAATGLVKAVADVFNEIYADPAKLIQREDVRARISHDTGNRYNEGEHRPGGVAFTQSGWVCYNAHSRAGSRLISSDCNCLGRPLTPYDFAAIMCTDAPTLADAQTPYDFAAIMCTDAPTLADARTPYDFAAIMCTDAPTLAAARATYAEQVIAPARAAVTAIINKTIGEDADTYNGVCEAWKKAYKEAIAWPLDKLANPEISATWRGLQDVTRRGMVTSWIDARAGAAWYGTGRALNYTRTRALKQCADAFPASDLKEAGYDLNPEALKAIKLFVLQALAPEGYPATDNVALYLYGPQRGGKTTLAGALAAVLNGCTEITPDHCSTYAIEMGIESHTRPKACDFRAVVLDEALPTDTRKTYGRFKDCITSNGTQINPKYQEPFNARTCRHYIICSNTDPAEYIQDVDERRIVPIYMPALPRTGEGYNQREILEAVRGYVATCIHGIDMDNPENVRAATVAISATITPARGHKADDLSDYIEILAENELLPQRLTGAVLCSYLRETLRDVTRAEARNVFKILGFDLATRLRIPGHELHEAAKKWVREHEENQIL